MSLFRPLLRAGSRLYRRIFQRRLDPKVREIAEVLGAVPAFHDLSSRALYAMAGVAHRRTYRRGEVLYFEGDPGLGLYVLERGQVRLISKADPDHPYELRELNSHEMAGELSLLGDFDRLETAETVTEAQVIGFFRPDLENVMRRDPRAGSEILTALARHVVSQHVELIRRMEERDGHRAAMETYAQAIEAADLDLAPRP